MKDMAKKLWNSWQNNRKRSKGTLKYYFLITSGRFWEESKKNSFQYRLIRNYALGVRDVYTPATLKQYILRIVLD